MSKRNLTRRDFLKLTTLSAAALQQLSSHTLQAAKPLNFLVVVYDAWSASNMYLEDYYRETMPNMQRLAEKAIVFHKHYSGGSFTSPGTSSLLTGTSAKTHRAFAGKSTVIPKLNDQNLFSFFNDAGYRTLAYTHNKFAEVILRAFISHIDDYSQQNSLLLMRQKILNSLFAKDYDTAFLSRDQILEAVPSNSLLLSELYQAFLTYRTDQLFAAYGDRFPLGLPSVSGNYFLLEDATDHIVDTAHAQQAPYLAYYHLLPPHSPYTPPVPYYDRFIDGKQAPIQLPNHILGEGRKKWTVRVERRRYDEFLLYVDQEINRLYESLEANGSLENTVLVITSDHGELNDRDFIHHGKATLHEPVIRIPLYIFMPGQTERVDVTDLTTALDVLPTLLSLAGLPIPESCEGGILPPFSDHSLFSRQPYSIIHSPTTYRNRIVKNGTIMVMHEGYKLTKYVGYKPIPKGEALFEMYDLNTDPYEINDIYLQEPEIAAELTAEIDKLMADEALTA